MDEYDEIAEEQEEPPLDAVAESAITTTDWTVETIVSQIQKGNIDLNPQFQRRFAWTNLRRSQFIESLALRYPVPQIVLARDPSRSNRLLVLDGKQRLMTLAQFFGVKKIGRTPLDLDPLKLTGLAIKTEWNDQTLSSIKRSGVRNRRWIDDLAVLENATIRSVVVSTWQSEEFLYSIFVRLNQGSLPLSPQELRQALKHGEFTSFADSYSGKSPGLRKILGLDGPDFRMRDVELFIRYIAFRLRASTYRGNLKLFLDETCDFFNQNWATQKTAIEKECRNLEASIAVALEVFGDENAFKKYMKTGYEARLNRAVFDVVVYALSEPTVRNALKQPAKAKKLKTEFERLSLTPQFRKSVESTTKSLDATRTRFTRFLAIVNNVTGCDVQFGLE
ncbi:DUF262 domain-containing protein [Burkholderia pseudomallei]|uniref:DUF262 domain-containing protein n=1 Tax=Burkholderia pseudomallei TaxID=28450 RepID=UPI000975ECCB|nr:DUF262 domain-containing protein [Burkholderia pseudomallei]NAX10176.1 DUF262 domain-containing protein [Burkholderia pseudomallei]NAX99011.1 DUF262 domain-containing protein [Burkholderia pseudomallei]NAY17644.1 DUF262 domain-containing protein [Burkholderia pseudomallei]NAY24487.1 DUF262 domain-containing protein [Burkholderia pseudomallei]NAY31418.1 DUF262 domain-containing protein [Burkholderia pseudomallei]